MTAKSILAKIIEEVGDQHSATVQGYFESIQKLLDRQAFLESVISQMEEDEENATFQLVTSLPSSGKTGIYYIVLNSTSNKYEEYKWNGTSFDKVGLIEDEVYPELIYTSVYHEVDKTGAGYLVANPSEEGWWEGVESQNAHQSNDEKTYVDVWTPVDKEGAGYSEKVPSTEGWYESDGDGGYDLSQAASVDPDTTYYVHSQDTAKTYYTVDQTYYMIPATNNGYSSMNPKHLDWYERDDLTDTFFPTTDTSPQQGKTYYRSIVFSK